MMIRTLAAGALMLLALTGTFIYGMVRALTSEVWPE